MKYLFWACEEDAGIFEPMNQETFLKFKRMSKYKKEEVSGLNQEGEEPAADSVQLGKREMPEQSEDK